MAKQEHQTPVITSQRCLCIQLSFQEPAGQGGSRLCGPSSYTSPGPTLDRSLKSDKYLCLVRALSYYLDRTSDRTKSWSLSLLKKVLTRTSHLSLSPHGLNRLWSYVMSSLIRRTSPGIRLKPMMSGPLLLLRPSSRESPLSKSYQPATGSRITPSDCPSHSSV